MSDKPTLSVLYIQRRSINPRDRWDVCTLPRACAFLFHASWNDASLILYPSLTNLKLETKRCLAFRSALRPFNPKLAQCSALRKMPFPARLFALGPSRLEAPIVVLVSRQDRRGLSTGSGGFLHTIVDRSDQGIPSHDFEFELGCLESSALYLCQ